MVSLPKYVRTPPPIKLLEPRSLWSERALGLQHQATLYLLSKAFKQPSTANGATPFICIHEIKSTVQVASLCPILIKSEHPYPLRPLPNLPFTTAQSIGLQHRQWHQRSILAMLSMPPQSERDCLQSHSENLRPLELQLIADLQQPVPLLPSSMGPKKIIRYARI